MVSENETLSCRNVYDSWVARDVDYRVAFYPYTTKTLNTLDASFKHDGNTAFLTLLDKVLQGITFSCFHGTGNEIMRIIFHDSKKLASLPSGQVL